MIDVEGLSVQLESEKRVRIGRMGCVQLRHRVRAPRGLERHDHGLGTRARTGNLRAQQVYHRYGYRRVGERKNYYPADGGGREDAIVMSYKL